MIHRVKLLDLKSLDLGRLKIHGANGQFLPVCICFYDGQTCPFLPNTLTLRSDGLIFFRTILCFTNLHF